MRFNIISLDLSFNESPTEDIGIILYFTGCNKALAGCPCISSTGVPCHNPDLFVRKESDYKTWSEIKFELDKFLNSDLLEINTIIFCGGEPCDNIPEFNELSRLIKNDYPNLSQVLFTHYTKLPDGVDTSNIDWIKHGEWGKNQWYINTKTNERKVLYNVD